MPKEDSDEKKYYCGMGPVPKGKIRAPPEYCIQHNQVRYYGIVAIDKKLLKTAKGSTTDLIKEQLKLRKLQDDAKILVKEVKNLKIILDNDKLKPSAIRKAEDKMDKLMVKRDQLIKKLKKQKNVVDILEKEEKKKKSKKKKSKR